jgi:glucose-1-phosphate thymidylyltransferase
MTAIVLAGGRGRRLQASDASALASEVQRRAAARGLKVLMPVGPDGRRLVDVVLERLVEAGVRDVVLVVPPDHAELAAHLAAHPTPGLRTRLAVQPVANGTAGAVAAAAPHVTAPACLVVNGDNVYPADALTALVALDGCGLAGFTRASLEHDSGFPPERVAAFAIVEHDADGWLTGIREKPPVDLIAPDTPVSMNLWRMDQAMLAACADVAPSPRGELELPDAVLLAVSRGTRVKVMPATGAVLDLTTAADVAVVSRALAPQETGA